MAGARERAAALADAPPARLLTIGLILIAAAAAVLVMLFAGESSSDARPLDDEPITVKRSLSTSATLFGDPVEAEIAVYWEAERIAARSVRVSATFEPYRVTAKSVERRRQGNVMLVHTRFALECLTVSCLPPRGEARVIQLPTLAVTYASGGRSRRMLVPWEPLQVSSRLPLNGRASAAIVDSAPPLGTRFERSPATLQALLLAVAVGFGLAGTALVVTGLWPSSTFAQRRQRRLSPLERSLQRVEAAAAGSDEAFRRKALDALATNLSEVPSPTLEGRARALAWGERQPDPEALTHLAGDVRETLNGRASA